MRRLRRTWTFLLVVSIAGALGACGGGGKGADEPLGKKQHVDGPPPGGAPAADAKLSAAECTGLFEHIVALLEKGLPPDQWEAGKQDLAAERDRMIKDCQEGETTRAQYDCMMRAAELSQIPDCVPQGS